MPELWFSNPIGNTSWWARAHKNTYGKLEKVSKTIFRTEKLLTEIINSMKELNSRREPTEPRIIKLANRDKEITQNIAQREKIFKKKLKHMEYK